MIGDHYTDEDEEYKKTIPVLICNLEYKCKRCGEVYSDMHVPLRGFIAEVSTLNEVIARHEKNDPYYPQGVDSIKSHLCPDGGFGVAEYVGIKITKE